MVIPESAPNPALAHEWINFTLRPEIAKMNAEHVGYTSPIQSVIDELTAVGGEYEGIDAYVPRQGYEKDEEFFYDIELKKEMNKYWEKIISQ